MWYHFQHSQNWMLNSFKNCLNCLLQKAFSLLARSLAGRGLSVEHWLKLSDYVNSILPKPLLSEQKPCVDKINRCQKVATIVVHDDIGAGSTDWYSSQFWTTYFTASSDMDRSTLIMKYSIHLFLGSLLHWWILISCTGFKFSAAKADPDFMGLIPFCTALRNSRQWVCPVLIRSRQCYINWKLRPTAIQEAVSIVQEDYRSFFTWLGRTVYNRACGYPSKKDCQLLQICQVDISGLAWVQHFFNLGHVRFLLDSCQHTANALPVS